jgi:invasion protein IalB
VTSSNRTERRSGRRPAMLFFAILLLATIANAAPGQRATAQQNSTAVPKAGGAEIAPRGQREVKDITYGDWRKLCFKPGGSRTLCRTSITGTFTTGQVAVRVDIVEREGDATARLQVFSPVGMYLPNPVKITIDQGTSHSVPYIWCLTNACIAGTAADPKMVEEMDSGRTLRLEFVDSNLLLLTTSLPLAEFASIHKGAPAQTLEQDIDE